MFEVPHQPAPATPVHVPNGQSRDLANRAYGLHALGARNEGFPDASIFDLAVLPRNVAREGD